jgi:hypothetical protein
VAGASCALSARRDFRTHESATTDNILEGVALSVECDQHPQEARQALETILGEPTVVVESGGDWTNPKTGEIEPKVHLHWRLNKPTVTKAEHAVLREARNLATDLVGGDGTNKSIVHPIRWPGSWHRKGTPSLAKIVARSENEIDLAEALEHLRDASGAAGLDLSKAGKQGHGSLLAAFKAARRLAAVPAAVAAALAVIPNVDRSWDDWNYFGMAIYGATGGCDVGRQAFATWSAKCSKNDSGATARWRHYDAKPSTGSWPHI